jgi:ferritin-like metal-binding protein YciE
MALPKMAEHASNEDLKAAFESHLEETQGHVRRLEQVFRSLEHAPRAKKCEAMAGLIKECQSILEEKGDPQVIDALIIAGAQKCEHYEIATYGTLCTWARMLGYDTALELMKETMDEEESADEKLSELAETINEVAMAGAEEEEEEEEE